LLVDGKEQRIVLGIATDLIAALGPYVDGVDPLDILPALKREDSRPRWDIVVYDVTCS